MNNRQRILDKLGPSSPPASIPPVGGSVPGVEGDQVSRFIEAARTNNCAVAKLDKPGSLPRWLAGYIEEKRLAPALITAHQDLLALPWQDQGWHCSEALSEADGALAISWARCAIAQSGSVLLVASANNPPALNFLPDHHIVVVQCRDIVPTWEAAWQLCRKRWNTQHWPRGLYFISGPSSSADVGLTQVFGAHGPRHLTFLLVSESNIE